LFLPNKRKMNEKIKLRKWMWQSENTAKNSSFLMYKSPGSFPINGILSTNKNTNPITVMERPPVIKSFPKGGSHSLGYAGFLQICSHSFIRLHYMV